MMSWEEMVLCKVNTETHVHIKKAVKQVQGKVKKMEGNTCL